MLLPLALLLGQQEGGCGLGGEVAVVFWQTNTSATAAPPRAIFVTRATAIAVATPAASSSTAATATATGRFSITKG